MITEIRKSLQDRGMKIALWIMLAVMALTFAPQFFMRNPTGGLPAIATVNGVPLDMREFQRRTYQEQEQIQRIRQQFGPGIDQLLKSLGMDNPEELALRRMIAEELVSKATLKFGIDLSPEYIAQKLQDPSFIMQELADIIPPVAFNPDGTINMKMLRTYLMRQGLSVHQFEQIIEKRAERNFLLALNKMVAYIPEESIKAAFVADAGKKYQYLLFNNEVYLKKAKATPLASQELEEFYSNANTQSKRYWVPEKRAGVAWVFAADSYGIDISPAAMQEYYQKNRHKKYLQDPVSMKARHILFMAKDESRSDEISQRAQKIQEILAKDPSQFQAEIDRLANDSTVSAGALGYIKKGEREPALDAALFALKNDGDVSPVIRTKQGFEILQRIEKKVATFKPFEEVAASIKKDLIKESFAAQFPRDAQEVMKAYKESPQAIQGFAESKKAVKTKLPLTTKADADSISQNLYKVKKDEWALSVQADKAYLISPTDIEVSHQPELAQVRAAVERDLYQEKAHKLLTADLEAAYKEIKDTPNGSLETIAKTYSLPVKTTEFVKGDDAKEAQALTAQGLPIGDLQSLKSVGSSKYGFTPQGGYLATLNEVAAFDPVAYGKTRSAILQKLYAQQKEGIQAAFIASLFRNATINRNSPSVVEQQVYYQDYE